MVPKLPLGGVTMYPGPGIAGTALSLPPLAPAASLHANSAFGHVPISEARGEEAELVMGGANLRRSQTSSHIINVFLLHSQGSEQCINYKFL